MLMTVLGKVPVVGSTTPSVSNIEILFSGTSGRTDVGIVFHDGGSDDGRVLTKKHFSQDTNPATFVDMGNDDAGTPVDHTGEWTTDVVTESEWEVACVSIEDGGPFDDQHANVGTYTTLDTTDMLWEIVRPSGKSRTPGTSVLNATFRIREVADTGNFTEFTVKLTAIQT